MVEIFKIHGPVLINHLFFPEGVENADKNMQIFCYVNGVNKTFYVNGATLNSLNRLKHLAESGDEFESIYIEAKTLTHD